MYSFIRSLLSCLLILLGFSACDNEEGYVDEYGSPYATFKVKGSVVTQQQESIRSIKAVFYQEEIIRQVDTTYSVVRKKDSVWTDDAGKFELSLGAFPTDQQFLLRLEDPRGDYQTRIDTVRYVKPSFVNGSGWYEGVAEKDLKEIVLHKREK